MKVNGNKLVRTLITSSEVCSSTQDGNTAAECHPTTPYTFSDAPVLKLDLTKDEVKQQIADFIVSLGQYGVVGISVMSASLSNIDQLRAAIEEKSSSSNSSLMENMFVYFEIRSEAAEPDFSTPEPDLTYFSPRLAAHTRSILSNGYDNEAGFSFGNSTLGVLNMTFLFRSYLFYETRLTFGQFKILAYEHHEVTHSDRYTAWGYPVFEAMDRADEVTATLLLLLTTPHLGIPRIIWDYSTTDATAHWQGPPTYGNRSAVSVFDSPPSDAAAQWDHYFPGGWNEWIIPASASG
ncbi:uncharacterized protein LOC129600235 isoform X2 [Paramacrobiotus metropolitanus]|uniref:uncharacterized protein LOC129600235 isoform X2 n=1 Tax=Paramacrobiotus metropolitanus TaxID=2943436 RepID=UPI002445D7A9|nr:uncharacterized protein LOC129600235 isoform X2 [Paramacrobiotus metropolitanus]